MTGNTIEIYEDAAGEYRWRLRMCGEILAVSSEGYTNKSDCWDAAWTVKSLAVFDSIRSQYRLEWYVDAAAEIRWRLRHQNGNIVADSREGYTDLDRFESHLTAFKRYSSRARMSDRTVDD